jgi:hypothetical protein
MPRFRDLTGQIFHYYTVLEYAGKRGKNGASIWRCRCKCGTEKVVHGNTLIAGESRSCGCFRRALAKERKKIHGESADGKISNEYMAWVSMRSRCSDVNHPSYEQWGGRGIRVCDRWQNSFENFLLDMGRKPSPKHSLDRIDNDKGYEPGNCRWGTRKQQQGNRRNSIWLEYKGIKLVQSDWVKLLKSNDRTFLRYVKAKPFYEVVEFLLKKNNITL